MIDQMLRGKRKPSPRLAVKLEQTTGIPRLTWLYGSTEEIKAALADFFHNGSN